MSETIGIIGLGDLGGQLTLQAEAAGYNVITYEPFTPKIPKTAIDPDVIITGLAWPPKQVEHVETVFSEAEVIHWCAPSAELPDVVIADDQMLILHDSVMHSSYANARRILGLGTIGIAHCLMNKYARVNVANDLPGHEHVAKHFTSLQLDATTKSIDEHDKLMAHTQASLAYGVLFDLANIKEADPADFTPSGAEYDDAITHRAAHWTLPTLRTIFQNPNIPELDRVRALARIDELQKLGYTTVNE